MDAHHLIPSDHRTDDVVNSSGDDHDDYIDKDKNNQSPDHLVPRYWNLCMLII